jgi:uncharacterized protein
LRLFELNEKAGRPLDIRDFSKFYRFVDRKAELGSDSYNSMVRPGALINVDHTGNISTFCPELLMGHSKQNNPFIFGNVKYNDFCDMSSDDRFQRISEKVLSGRKKCRETCDYFMVCGGGSPSNRFAEHKALDTSETLFCKNQIQTVADAVMDYLEGGRSGPIRRLEALPELTPN